MKSCKNLLKAKGVTQRMSRKATCLDNDVAENFFWTVQEGTVLSGKIRCTLPACRGSRLFRSGNRCWPGSRRSSGSPSGSWKKVWPISTGSRIFTMKCFPGRDLTKATLSGNKENGRQNLWQMCRRTTLPQKCARPDMNGWYKKRQ